MRFADKEGGLVTNDCMIYQAQLGKWLEFSTPVVDKVSRDELWMDPASIYVHLLLRKACFCTTHFALIEFSTTLPQFALPFFTLICLHYCSSEIALTTFLGYQLH